MKKDTNFRKQIPFNKSSNSACNHEDLVLKCPSDLWENFICDDLIELMLEPTLL